MNIPATEPAMFHSKQALLVSNTSPFSNYVSRHDVDFFGVLKLIWQGGRLILLLSTLFGLSAYTYTRLITSEYQVASVLRPVERGWCRKSI